MRLSLLKIIRLAAAGLILFTCFALTSCSGPDDKKQAFLDKGNRLFEQEDFKRARVEFKNALQIDPEYAEASFCLGKTELKLKNFKQAFAALSRAVELAPENPEARLNLGKLLLAGKAPGRAGEHARAILEQDPGHIEGRMLMSSIHFVNKEVDEGEAILQALYQEGYTGQDLYVMLASVAKLRKDKDLMRKYLEEGLAKNPDAVSLVLAMARLESEEENYDAVVERFRKAVELKPEVLRYKLNLARILLAMDKPADAQNVLNAALAREKAEDEKIRMAVAGFWLSLRQPEKAKALVEEGLKLDPDSFGLRHFLADIHVKARQVEDAEALLRDTLALNPDPAHPQIVKTRTALAKLLLLKAAHKEGEAMVDEVLAQDPRNVDAHFMKGRLYLMRKDGPNAVAEFRIVSEDRPRALMGHLNLARAHLLSKEPHMALDVLEKALEKIPGSAQIRSAMAHLHMINKQTEAAREDLELAVQENPDKIRPLLDLGDFHMALKNPETALAQYRAALKIKENLAEALLKSAAALNELGQKDEALATLVKGYEKNPASPRIFTALVRARVAQKQYGKALDLCRARLDKNGDDAFAWNLMGSVHMMEKKFDEAQKAFEMAARLKPEWGRPYDNLARLFLVKGEKKQAIQRFNAALEKNPKNKAAWMVLAGLHERDREYEKAAAAYEKAFTHNPDLWSAANNFAFIRSELAQTPEDLQRAMDFARKAEALNPDSSAVLDTLGWIQFKTGDLSDAKEKIAKALDENPEDHILNYHLGALLAKEGDLDRARPLLEKSLTAKADFPGKDDAKRLLKTFAQ